MCDNRAKRQSGGERMSQMIYDRKIPTRGGGVALTSITNKSWIYAHPSQLEQMVVDFIG